MTETVELEIGIEECYPDYAGGREPTIPSRDEWDDEIAVKMTTDIKKSEFLRERAEGRLNGDDLPQAETLLWVDQAEVYSLCDDHYREKRDGAWTGFTENPNYHELREKMQERLSNGVPCSSCRRERIEKLKAQIEEEIEISIEVVEDG